MRPAGSPVVDVGGHRVDVRITWVVVGDVARVLAREAVAGERRDVLRVGDARGAHHGDELAERCGVLRPGAVGRRCRRFWLMVEDDVDGRLESLDLPSLGLHVLVQLATRGCCADGGELDPGAVGALRLDAQEERVARVAHPGLAVAEQLGVPRLVVADALHVPPEDPFVSRDLSRVVRRGTEDDGLALRRCLAGARSSDGEHGACGDEHRGGQDDGSASGRAQ